MINLKGKWALVLGASSGFGEACALALAKEGVNICGVHLDRKATLDHVEEVVGKIRATGAKAAFFNVNAADPEVRKQVLDELEKLSEGKPAHVLLHSLAFGTLKTFVASDEKTSISQKQVEMTLDVMANSLIYWVQDMVWRRLLDKGSKVYAMTSAGGHSVWPTYGAVSAAKAALESHVRQLGFELAPKGIAVNALQAGVTDTPALRRIPGHEQMIELSTARNPSGRLTTPEEIAQSLVAFSLLESHWMTANVIRIDGGEDVVG